MTKTAANTFAFTELKPDLTNLPMLNLWATRGLSITLFAMIVALIPPPGTSDVWLHEAKLAGGSLFLVLIGFFIYCRARRKRLV